MRRVLLSCCVAASLVAADPADPSQADTLLQVGDASWIEREAARFATSLGQDPMVLRQHIAETLYHAHSLEGIDTLRPAMLWWRGRGVMTGLIPLKDRRAFTTDFGIEQPPLVRVGEREGTVVFTQNLSDGLREYRLLATEDTAIIARTVDEARRLVPRIPDLLVTDPSQPVLRLVVRGEALERVLRIPAWLPLLRIPASGLDPRPGLNALLSWLARESSVLTVELRAVGSTHARMTVALKAKVDGDLAQWLNGQQNQATRIAALVDTPSTALVMTARMNWHGRLDVIGDGLLPAQRSTVGNRWTGAVDDSWRQVWRLGERVGELGMAVAVAPDGTWSITTIGEQPRAIEQATHLNALAAAATGDAGRSAESGGLPTTARLVDGHFEITAAGPRHLVSVITSPAQAAAAQTSAVHLATIAAQVVPPRGTAALVVLHADLARLVRLVPGVDREAEIAPAVLDATVTARPGGVLQLDAVLPLEPTAQALAKLPAAWW